MRNHKDLITAASQTIGAVITDLEAADDHGHPAEYSPIAAELDRVRIALLAGVDSIPPALDALRAARLALTDDMSRDNLQYATMTLIEAAQQSRLTEDSKTN